MSGLAYHGADGGAVIPYREYMRQRFPGPASCVILDLDVVLRFYSSEDPTGRFLLLECKYGQTTRPTGGQVHTFRLMHDLLVRGDPGRIRYRGMFLANYDLNEKGEFVPRRLTNWSGRVLLDDPTPDDFDCYLTFLLRPKELTA